MLRELSISSEKIGFAQSRTGMQWRQMH